MNCDKTGWTQEQHDRRDFAVGFGVAGVVIAIFLLTALVASLCK